MIQKCQFETIHKLLYRSSLDKENSKLILDHISENYKTGLFNGKRGLQIVSDIDDTMTCSGDFPGGCDELYAKHDLYPGVLAFYRELDRYTNREISIKCNNKKNKRRASR